MLLIINWGVLPGTILAFSGEFDTDGYPIDKLTGLADKGWHLCDGTNGTPDLRGLFILGASDAHAVGSTGGEEDTGLSIDHLPPHSFSGTTSTANLKGSFRGNDWSLMGDASGIVTKNWNEGKRDAPNGSTSQNIIRMDINASHDHTFTTNTLGSGVKHNNMPPYYTLAFIMKI